MFNLSLTACSFHLMELYSRDPKKSFYLNKSIKVKSEDGEIKKPEPVRVLFETFFNEYRETISDDKRRTTFAIDYQESYCGEMDNFNFFYAIIRSGIYGSASNIKNIRTHKVTHNMTS